MPRRFLGVYTEKSESQRHHDDDRNWITHVGKTVYDQVEKIKTFDVKRDVFSW
jgi:hypothetical protein